MKFFAAAILAFGASAIRLEEEKLPHEPPTCPAFDLAFAQNALASAANFVASVNTDGDDSVSTKEVFDALWCIHEWKLATKEEAVSAYEDFQDAAGADGKVAVADAIEAIQKEMDAGKMAKAPTAAPTV